jgi:hypothetical protein
VPGWHYTAAGVVAPALVEKGAYSIKEWCAYRGYSVATFYKMKKNGVAPRITELPGAPPRISQEADHEWLAAANNRNAETEHLAEQRQERARKAAARAIESPRHVSRRAAEIA